VNIDKAIRAMREFAREGLERRIVEHAPGKSDS
jgi:hypothetical protein